MLEQVKASAGSGKTYALTAAFLGFLANAQKNGAPACGFFTPAALLDDNQEDDGPGEYGPEGYGWTDILAMTFTNKAAAEMKGRVLDALKKIALADPKAPEAPGWTQAKAADWVETLIRRFGLLNIRTIDSLLHLLLQQSALGLDLPPDFEPVFKVEAIVEPIYDALVARAEAEDGPERRAIQAVGDALLARSGKLGFLARAQLKERLANVLALRITTPGVFFTDAALLGQTISGLEDAHRASLNALAALLAADQLATLKNFQNFLVKLHARPPGRSLPDSVYSAKPGLADCLLKKSQNSVTDAVEAAYTAFKNGFVELASRGGALRDAAQLLPFLAIAEALLDEADAWQRQRGQVLNMRWPELAKRLFDDPAAASEAFCRLGGQLAHVLIDEFQDTSRPQWEAIEPLAAEALSRGGALFYVGDVKQAIYGWRGGDASLFDAVPQQPCIAAVAGQPIARTLDYNWRSGAAIVDFNNEWLARLTDQAEDVARAMLANGPEPQILAFAQAIRDAYRDGGQLVPPTRAAASVQGYVRLQTIYGQDAGELEERVRDALKTLLCDEILTRRPCRDAAILVRSNKQAKLVSQWCIEWGLPVITENSLLLAEHPLIRQTAAFLAFLDYGRNDLAFWEFISGRELFGPVSGLDQDTLCDWLCATRAASGKRTTRPLYQQFQSDFPELWTRWIDPFFRRAGLMSPYDLVSGLYERYKTFELAERDTLFLRRFLETVHAAETAVGLSISSFLEFWEEAGADAKAPFPENIDAVRVMTLHKAKGLQFPATIIPFHHFTAETRDDLAAVPAASLLGPERGGDALLLTSLSKNLGEVYYQRLAAQLLEQLNMLYVAWTRPVDELYAFITEAGRSGRSQLATGLRVLLAPWGLDADEAVYERGERPKPAVTPPPTPDALASLDRAFGPRHTADALVDDASELMSWLPRLKIFRSAFETETFAERQRGELAHRCLEQLRVTPDAAADVERALFAGLRGMSNPHDPAAFAQELEALEHELRASLSWARSLPELQELLRLGLPEQEILDEDGRMHRVDLLAETPERVVVVEYKTGGPHPEHEQQVRRYLGLLEQMDTTRGKTTEGLIIYLRARECVRVGGRQRP